ncbi:hypothetical protein E2I00_014962 [Balaenoptera physalus]|uniref:Uncharacterized protein n=1 Tax=Balaenoptera physalus TaxID=9770 RepID=A0A6A1PYQ3_BALPH|nr:hypothetical protein E2I00_014962 [Balaenoptera physalus]
MSICTNLSSRWTVFQSSIFGAFVIYLVVLFSVAFMCWSMMRALTRTSNEMHLAGKFREGSSKLCSAEDHSWGQGQLSSVESAKKISEVPGF